MNIPDYLFRQSIEKKNIFFPSDPTRLHSLELLMDKTVSEGDRDTAFGETVMIRRADWTPLVSVVPISMEENDEGRLVTIPRSIILCDPIEMEDGENIRIERVRAGVGVRNSPDKLVITSEGPNFNEDDRSFLLRSREVNSAQIEVARITNLFVRLFSPAA